MFLRLTEDVYQTAKVAKVLLLLNVGKGSEFKGKSLEEIEVTDDVLECDDEEKEEHEIIAEIEGEKEQENDMAQFNVDEENRLASAVDNTDEVQTKKTEFLNNKLGNRMRWANKEKQLVLKHFKKHIQTKTAPKKHECLTFIEEHPEVFSISDWVRIKTLIFNTYRTK